MYIYIYRYSIYIYIYVYVEFSGYFMGTLFGFYKGHLSFFTGYLWISSNMCKDDGRSKHGISMGYLRSIM